MFGLASGWISMYAMGRMPLSVWHACCMNEINEALSLDNGRIMPARTPHCCFVKGAGSSIESRRSVWSRWRIVDE